MKLRMKPEKKILATGRILESREGFILFFLMVEHLLVPEILCPQLLLLGFLELVSFLFWSKITSANKRLKTHEECSRRSLPRDSPWIAVGRYLHHARLAPPNKDYMPSEIGNVHDYGWTKRGRRFHGSNHNIIREPLASNKEKEK